MSDLVANPYCWFSRVKAQINVFCIVLLGHLETQEATTKLQQLSKKIDNLKQQVYDITVNKYANFVPKLHATEQLVGDVEKIKTEMDEVSNKIENEVFH